MPARRLWRRALAAALLLHAAVISLLLWLGQNAPEPRAPDIEVTLEFEASTSNSALAATAVHEPEAVVPRVPDHQSVTPATTNEPALPDAVSPPPAQSASDPIGVPPTGAPAETPPVNSTKVDPVPARAPQSPGPAVSSGSGGPSSHSTAQRSAAVRAPPTGVSASRPGANVAPATFGRPESVAGVPPTAATTISPSWQSELSAWILAHKSYPEPARLRSEEGTVTLRFVVAHDGRVLDVELNRRSGFGALDDAAVAMLRNAQVPPFPASMPQAQMVVTVSVRYSLKR